MVLRKPKPIVLALGKNEEVCGIIAPAIPKASNPELSNITFLKEAVKRLVSPSLKVRKLTSECKSAPKVICVYQSCELQDCSHSEQPEPR